MQIQGERLNLLLAAAITTAPTAEASSDEEEDQEQRDEMSLTQALEQWTMYKAKEGKSLLRSERSSSSHFLYRKYLDSPDCVRLQLDHNASCARNHNALRHLTS